MDAMAGRGSHTARSCRHAARLGFKTSCSANALVKTTMPILFAITILFMMQAAGEVLARLTGLPLPGPLIGMLLMLAALMAYGRVPAGLRDTCHHVLRHQIGITSCRERVCQYV